MTATTSARVPALIASLDDYPDERAEIVSELRRSGDDAAALSWLYTLTAAGGLDASMARVEVADIHFEAGRADLAMAELDAIKDSRGRDPDAYSLAAELLAERGDHEGALRWFAIGASRLSEEDLAARGEYGWMSRGYGICGNATSCGSVSGTRRTTWRTDCVSHRVGEPRTRRSRRPTRRCPTRTCATQGPSESSPGRFRTLRSPSSAGRA